MVHLPIAGVEISWFLVMGLGLVIGALAGFFGVGGGFLLTPMLNALLGVPYSVAVGSTLSQMIGLSSSATMRHARLRHIDYRLGCLILIGSVPGAELGAQVIELLKSTGTVAVCGASLPLITFVMSVLYAVVLTSIGTSIAREAAASARREETDGAEPQTSAMHLLRGIKLRPMVALPASGIEGISLWILIAVGLLVGFLSGLMGVGGGFILMPTLIYAIGCPTLVAIGTGVFQTVFTAVYGAYTHSMKGNVDLLLGLLLLVGSAVGAYIGAGLTQRFDSSRVRGAFAVLTFISVVIVLGKLLITIFGHSA